MDASVGIVGSEEVLHAAGDKKLYPSVTGGRELPSGRDYLDQTGNNDFEVQEGQIPVLSVLVSTSEAVCLLGCPLLETYVYYPMDEKKLVDWLCLIEIAVAVYFVCVGREYRQCEGCGWWGYHCLRYETYLIPSSYDLKA